MEIKSKSLDEINEITDDTKTGITTTLEHTIDFEKYKKMYGRESEIFKILLEELKKGTFSDCDEEFQYCCYQIISNLQQENKQLKNNWNYIKKMLKEARQEKYISGYCGTCTDIDIDFLLDKMQELQGSDSNE